MLKKILMDKINGTRNFLFFPSRAPAHHRFTFNLRFSYEMKHKVRLSERLIFCSTKYMDVLTLKRQISFQNQSNRKATHSFATRPLVFRLLKKVLKFNDICVSCSSPKTELVTNFLNLEHRSVENVSFS